MSGEVRLTGRITIPAAEQRELVPLLGEHARLCRAEEGCLRFDVARDAEDGEAFSVSELFIDDTAFAAHAARTRASEWGRRSAHLVREFERSIAE
jgi:putative acetyltransferase